MSVDFVTISGTVALKKDAISRSIFSAAWRRGSIERKRWTWVAWSMAVFIVSMVLVMILGVANGSFVRDSGVLPYCWRTRRSWSSAP